MATSLAEIRAKLQEAEARNSGNNTSSVSDNSIYPHWNIDEGAVAKLRFLPDANTKNSFFWVERSMIKLPFAGIKGQNDSRPVIVQVPCMEMYGKDTPCPILAEVRTWFKDPALEDKGRRYWKKKSYFFQGFVRENPLNDDKTPDNPIRKFIISPQIFNLVKSALMDPELENLPTDYDSGLDFIVVKSSKGGYADYSTSKWARKESALTIQEREAIEQYGLFNLTDFLPKKPTDVELRVIKEMFDVSKNDGEYDPDSWAQYYKPSGFNFSGSSKSSSDETPAPRQVAAKPLAVQKKETTASDTPPWDTDDDSDVVTTAPAVAATTANKSSNQRAEDILAMIRNRQKQ